MASTFGVAGPLTSIDEKGLDKVRRSRLSLHMKTRRVRRWLLVQLVSVPVGQQDPAEPQAVPTQQERLEEGLNNMAFERMMVQQSRTWM